MLYFSSKHWYHLLVLVWTEASWSLRNTLKTVKLPFMESPYSIDTNLHVCVNNLCRLLAQIIFVDYWHKLLRRLHMFMWLLKMYEYKVHTLIEDSVYLWRLGKWLLKTHYLWKLEQIFFQYWEWVSVQISYSYFFSCFIFSTWKAIFPLLATLIPVMLGKCPPKEIIYPCSCEKDH